MRHYAKAWTLLQRYDDKTLCIYTNLAGENFTLGYEEAVKAINELKEELVRKGEASQIFATQKAGEFEGILKKYLSNLRRLRAAAHGARKGSKFDLLYHQRPPV